MDDATALPFAKITEVNDPGDDGKSDKIDAASVALCLMAITAGREIDGGEPGTLMTLMVTSMARSLAAFCMAADGGQAETMQTCIDQAQRQIAMMTPVLVEIMRLQQEAQPQ